MNRTDADSGERRSQNDRSLRIALSGGGFRATLFDLGVLLYLVDAGLNVRVRQIASVSGGSIVNAFVAQRCDFSTVSAEDFEAIARDIMRLVVRRGLFHGVVIVTYLLLTALTIAAAVASLVTGHGFAFVVLIAAFAVLVSLRGRAMDHQLHVALSDFDAPATSGALSDITTSVEHIFCSTDLRTGMPFYFSTFGGGYVFSPMLGFAPCRLSLAKVVRASAAFPGGLPPLRYSSKWYFAVTREAIPIQLRMTGEWSTGHYRPTVFLLADGGMWNNLATQAFLEDRLWYGWDSSGQKRTQPAGLLIVANASAPVLASGIARFLPPLLGEGAALRRSLKLAIANTVVPRIEAIRERPDAAVVSILDSHGRALDGLAEEDVARKLPPDCDALRLYKRYLASDNTIGDMTWPFRDTAPWRVYDYDGYSGKADNNADVPTSFTRLPRWRAVLLVAHAYENAQAELSAVLGLPLPASPDHGTPVGGLLSETRRDKRSASRRDFASWRRARRKDRTLRTRKQATGPYGELPQPPVDRAQA